MATQSWSCCLWLIPHPSWDLSGAPGDGELGDNGAFLVRGCVDFWGSQIVCHSQNPSVYSLGMRLRSVVESTINRCKLVT